MPSPKDIRHQADLLRRRGKFAPGTSVKPSPEEQLRALGQEDRNAAAFDAATNCDYCARERREKSDESALCREHLAAAMGF